MHFDQLYNLFSRTIILFVSKGERRERNSLHSLTKSFKTDFNTPTFILRVELLLILLNFTLDFLIIYNPFKKIHLQSYS